MKRANVSELKARLSAYLDEVREGETVVVFDRRTPIAHLVPMAEAGDDVRIDESSVAPCELRRLAPVRLRRRVNIQALLRECRDQR